MFSSYELREQARNVHLWKFRRQRSLAVQPPGKKARAIGRCIVQAVRGEHDPFAAHAAKQGRKQCNFSL
jgi:hypothetical protein